MAKTDVIIDMIVSFITDPDSELYLPLILLGCSDPKLEPFTNGDVSLGVQTILKRDYDLVLTDLKIEGISNIQVEKENEKKDNEVTRIYIDGSAVTFYAKRPNTEAPELNLPAKLLLNANLIITPVGGNPLPKIHLTADIGHAQILGQFDATATGIDPKTIRITFNKLALQQMLDRADNIVLKITADSIFNQFLNKAINQDSSKLKLVTAINEQLSSATLLNSLSTEATRAAISALSAE